MQKNAPKVPPRTAPWVHRDNARQTKPIVPKSAGGPLPRDAGDAGGFHNEADERMDAALRGRLESDTRDVVTHELRRVRPMIENVGYLDIATVPALPDQQR